MAGRRTDGVHKLFAELCDAHGESLGTERGIARLQVLRQYAREGSDAWLFASLNLAEALVHQAPWRASLLLRQITRHDSENVRAWRLLGVAQSLLGHHRFAVASYERAQRLAVCPYTAHNLGHLRDLLDDGPGALSALRYAFEHAPMREVALSYAHALVRHSADLAGAWRAQQLTRSLVGAVGCSRSQRLHARANTLVDQRIAAINTEPHQPTRRVLRSRQSGVNARSATSIDRRR